MIFGSTKFEKFASYFYIVIVWDFNFVQKTFIFLILFEKFLLLKSNFKACAKCVHMFVWHICHYVSENMRVCARCGLVTKGAANTYKTGIVKSPVIPFCGDTCKYLLDFTDWVCVKEATAECAAATIGTDGNPVVIRRERLHASLIPILSASHRETKTTAVSVNPLLVSTLLSYSLFASPNTHFTRQHDSNEKYYETQIKKTFCTFSWTFLKVWDI